MNKKNNLISNLPWRTSFRGVAKFYFYLLVLHSLAFFLIWGYAYLALKNANTDLDRMLLDPLSQMKVREFNWESYKILAREMRSYMFLLACFGVFFASPPKNLKYLVLTASLMFLIATPLFVGVPIAAFLEYLLFFTGSVLLAWLCSLIWDKFKMSRTWF